MDSQSEQPIEAVFMFDNQKFNEMDDETKFQMLLAIHEIYSKEMLRLVLENNSKK